MSRKIKWVLVGLVISFSALGDVANFAAPANRALDSNSLCQGQFGPCPG